MSELDEYASRLSMERDAARDQVDRLRDDVDTLNDEIHDLKQQKRVLTDDRAKEREEAKFHRESLANHYDAKLNEVEGERNFARAIVLISFVLFTISWIATMFAMDADPRTLKLDLKDGTTYFVQYGEQIEIYVGEEQEVSE